MSLRGLINSRILFSVIIIVLVGGVLTIWQARHSVEREVNSSFKLALQMIDLGFSHLSRTSMTEYEWLQQISAIQHTRHLHISILNENGDEVEWFVSDELDEELPPEWFVRAVKQHIPVQITILNWPMDGLNKLLFGQIQWTRLRKHGKSQRLISGQ